MDMIRGWPIRRFEAGQFGELTDPVVTEARVELVVNDGAYRQGAMCSPDDLDAWAVGFLLSEGVLERREQLDSIEVLADEGRILVRGDFDADVLAALQQRWTRGTDCGGGGTSHDVDWGPYERVGPGPVIAAQRLCQIAKDLQSRAKLWKQTGGVHACALAGGEGILLFAEDVGRHNAFEKVVGRALLEGIDVADKFVLMTGRASALIVSKAAVCGVAMLVSRSSVTDLGIKLARRFGITLVGFLRGRRLNVYTGHERVTSDPGGQADKTR